MAERVVEIDIELDGALVPVGTMRCVPSRARETVVFEYSNDWLTCDIDLVLAVAPEFGLRTRHAREIVTDVARATATWREIAHQVGAPAREIDYLESAFEHSDLEKALAL